jgi:hypothetical protein
MEQKRVIVPHVYRIAIAAGVLILVAALTVLVHGTLSSGEANAQGQAECSLKTLEGTYAFEARGAMQTEQAGITVVLPYAEAGNQTFDGDGNFEGYFSASLNGTLIASQQYFTGTYRYEGNCVYTNFAPVGDEVLEFHLYTGPKGTSLSYSGPGISGRAVKP